MSLSRFPNALMLFSSPTTVSPAAMRSVWNRTEQQLDEIVRAGFKHDRDTMFLALIISTGIVVVGLVFEEAKLWFPSGKPKLDTVKGVFSPSPLIEWRKRLEIFGWIVIIGGVVGEGVFEGATSIADGLLQDLNNILLEDAQRQSDNAKTSAQVAAEAARLAKRVADDAESKGEQAIEKSGEAQTTASNASSLAQGAQNKADLVNKQVEAEQDKQEELIRALAPRQLWLVSYTDKTSNIDKLKEAKGKVVLEWIPDFEAEGATGEMGRMLTQAQWAVTFHRPEKPHEIRDGVVIETPPMPERPQDFGIWRSSLEGASTLQAFLIQNGWEAERGTGQRGDIEYGSIRVRVGYKPNPYFQDPQMKAMRDRFNKQLVEQYGFDATGKIEEERIRFGPSGSISWSVQ